MKHSKLARLIAGTNGTTMQPDDDQPTTQNVARPTTSTTARRQHRRAMRNKNGTY